METAPTLFSQYFPIVLMAVVAIGFVVTTMVLTHAFGPKRPTKVKDDTFECGIEVKGNARSPFSVKYFLVAILFVLFDVEVIFMYPWAVNFRELGVFGLIEMFSFMGLMIVGLIYIIRRGALKWD
ncbi:MAG: NADH-quinone oxidoreductase subunit A [Flavobacteriales bacterium]|jgi:NADH-quinone oxidoreductase subunit A|nr:NADH-quinone oxidoreductase subunit A [Flavobacteriales bacterium]